MSQTRVAALGAALLAYQRLQKLGGIEERDAYVFG